MAERKLLNFRETKPGMVVFGSKKVKTNVAESFARKLLMLSGKPMKIFNHERWLGDILGSSISESVFLTIQKRNASQINQ